jgi:hypothetical protein
MTIHGAEGFDGLSASINQLESLMISGTIVLARHVKEGIGFTGHCKGQTNSIWEYVTYPQTRSQILFYR